MNYSKLSFLLFSLLILGVLASCTETVSPADIGGGLEPTQVTSPESGLLTQAVIGPKEGKIIDDPSASGGRAAALYREGESVVFELGNIQDGIYKVSVRARGDLYKGPPVISLSLNKEQVGADNAVKTTLYKDQGFGQVTLEQGQVLEVVFTNDVWDGSPDKDRNVYIDHLTLTPAPNPEREPGDNLPSVQARSAAEFIDTIGVNTHLHYQDRVYYQRYEDLIKPKLLELGVRHVRDGVYTYEGVGPDTFYYQRLRELSAAGIRFNLITTFDTRYQTATDYTKLTDIVTWTDGAVVSFEGVNEPDLQGVPGWVALTRAAQKNLYTTLSNAGAPVAVLGPSPVWEKDALGDVSSFLDYGSVHPYPGGKMPTGSEYEQSTEAVLSNATVNSDGKPIMITETGYHNALHSDSDHLPTSEAATAKYLPRLLLEHFNRGIVRTYLYEFIDGTPEGKLTDPEASFGLLRNDGTEKPAYKALRNLIALLDDPAPGEPGTLSFELDSDTDDVHHTLLQKSDGTFYLALWLEKPSWDRHARKDISVPAQNVTLSLGAVPQGTTLHTLDGAGQMTGRGVSFQDNMLELTVTDSVSVLELRD